MRECEIGTQIHITTVIDELILYRRMIDAGICGREGSCTYEYAMQWYNWDMEAGIRLRCYGALERKEIGGLAYFSAKKLGTIETFIRKIRKQPLTVWWRK